MEIGKKLLFLAVLITLVFLSATAVKAADDVVSYLRNLFYYSNPQVYMASFWKLIFPQWDCCTEIVCSYGQRCDSATCGCVGDSGSGETTCSCTACQTISGLSGGFCIGQTYSGYQCPCTNECTWNSDCGSQPTSHCGNGQCESGETELSCPSDCRVEPTSQCGNGKCETGENSANCPSDCGSQQTCRDETCDYQCRQQGRQQGECDYNDNCQCYGQAAQCGNGQCESGESSSSCPQDCGSSPGTKTMCTCDSPNDKENNHFTCNKPVPSEYCSDDHVCTKPKSEAWEYGNFPCAKASTPTKVTCHCEHPNEKSPSNNFVCTDTLKNGWCSSGLVCTSSKDVEWEYGYFPCEEAEVSGTCPPGQLPPHWGVKNGKCLPSCGQKGGRLASCESKECEKGYTDVESYDCPHCCVPSACDPVKQPSPDWGIKDGKCLQSCGQASNQKGKCINWPYNCAAGERSVENYQCDYCCIPSEAATKTTITCRCKPGQTEKIGGEFSCTNDKDGTPADVGGRTSCSSSESNKEKCVGSKTFEKGSEQWPCEKVIDIGKKICDKDKGQVEPHWKEVKGRCLPSCGHGGGPTAECRQTACNAAKEEDIESWDCTALGKHCCVPKNDPGILDVGCRKPEYNIKTGQKCPLVLQGCTYCTCTGKDEKGNNITGQTGPNERCCVANGKIVGQYFGTECAKDEKGKGVECPSQIKPGDTCPKGCGDCWCVGGPVKCWIPEDSKCCVEYLNGRQICQSKPTKDSCGGATGMADCKIDTTSGWIYGDIPCKCGGKECKESYCIGGKVCSSGSGFGKITCTCDNPGKAKTFKCMDSSGKQIIDAEHTACKEDEDCVGPTTFSKDSPQWPCKKKGTEEKPVKGGDCSQEGQLNPNNRCEICKSGKYVVNPLSEGKVVRNQCIVCQNGKEKKDDNKCANQACGEDGFCYQSSSADAACDMSCKGVNEKTTGRCMKSVSDCSGTARGVGVPLCQDPADSEFSVCCCIQSEAPKNCANDWEGCPWGMKCCNDNSECKWVSSWHRWKCIKKGECIGEKGNCFLRENLCCSGFECRFEWLGVRMRCLKP